MGCRRGARKKSQMERERESRALPRSEGLVCGMASMRAAGMHQACPPAGFMLRITELLRTNGGGSNEEMIRQVSMQVMVRESVVCLRDGGVAGVGNLCMDEKTGRHRPVVSKSSDGGLMVRRGPIWTLDRRTRGGGVLVWEKRSYSKEEKRGKKSNLTWKEKKREGSVVSRRIRYSG